MNPSRRTLLTALGAGAVGLAGAAAAQEAVAPPVAPTAPDDATQVLGGAGGPTAERAAWESPSLTPGKVTGPSYSPLQDFVGTITPSDLQFQRHHGGIAIIDPSRYQLLVHGRVRDPLTLSLADLKRFPPTTRVHFLECAGNGRNGYRDPKPETTVQLIDGLTANLEWTGVLLKTVLAEVGVQPDARWLVAEGGDAAVLARSIPIEKALDDAMLVYAANGEPLRPAYGYPVRLLVPGWEANLNIKWLRRIELTDVPLQAKDETVKYADAMPGDKVRQFSFVMDAKSTITAPTFPTRLTGPGWWPITGLAWSGRGRIARVDVSTDGGATWTEAELQGAPLPKAHVRFRHAWRWDGGPAVLMSRATDETGYVQPTVQAFRATRGLGADYHFNAIRAWRVHPDGAVTFVPPAELT